MERLDVRLARMEEQVKAHGYKLDYILERTSAIQRMQVVIERHNRELDELTAHYSGLNILVNRLKGAALAIASITGMITGVITSYLGKMGG